MNTRSLGFRLVSWYAGLLILVFVVLGALTLIYLRHYLEANLLDTQARRARQIADTLLANATPGSEQSLAREVDELYSPAANERLIRITRADGRVLYEHVPAGTLLSATLRYPGPRTGKSHGAGGGYIVQVGASTESIEITLRRMLLMLAVGLPVAVAIAVGGGFALVRRALNPVDRIARTAEDITQHNLRQRLPVLQTGDELERLAVSLNHMIERLQDAIHSSERFVADASHELRTPLAVLRGELEGLAQSPNLELPVRETLGSLLEEVDRLTQIVDALLALSRLDAGAHLDRVGLNLAELAAGTAEQMSLLAEDKGVRVSINLEGLPKVMVEGDPARLKQVIVNLLDNAIKYTPNGGSVQLRVSEENGAAVLEIADEGVGIPTEALPHVFERFYRVDNSRSREQGGVGLGLAIVKSICAAHAVNIEVRSQPGRGSRFRLKFPPAPA